MERLNRQRYFLWRLALTPFIIGASEGEGFLLLLIALCIIDYCLGIGRLHDLDVSGWYSLLFFVPILNIFLGLYLLFAKGTDGANKYGEDLLKKQETVPPE